MRCKYWREYESIAGTIAYCEVAAFDLWHQNGSVRTGYCDPEMRTECLARMALYHGRAYVPDISKDRLPKTAEPA